MGYDLGLILLVLGVILIVVEIATPGFFIAVPGTVLIIYGILLILFPWLIEIPWFPWLLVLLSFPIGYFTYLIYRRLSPPSRPVTESYEGLIGKKGVVIETVKPDSLEGKVRIDSDIWSATSDQVIEPGVKVVVVGVEGVHLIVKPLEEEGAFRK
jgi:membrane protein implicated in regulation of membrane protease activity